MTDTKIPMRIFTSYEALTEYYGERPDMELGLYVSDEKLLVGHAPTAYSFNPQYFTGDNELEPNYVPASPIDYTINVAPNDTTYGYATGGGTYPEHTEITVNAYAYYGYKFDKWSNDVETSAYTFAVEEDADLTAYFVDNTYTVTTKPSAPGIGTTTGDGVYIAGTSVTVTAIPAEGYYFADAWRDEDTLEYVSADAEYTFTVEKNTNLMAIFAHYLTVSATPNNSNYGSTTGAGKYKAGTLITVTATPNENYRFVNWTNNGTEVSTDAEYTFTVYDDTALVANFEDPLQEPFYVENITNENETLNIAKSNDSAPLLNIEYSTDKTTWQTLGTTSTTALTYTLQAGDKVYLRCDTNEGWGVAGTDSSSNRISGCSKVGGNIMSLIYGSNFTGSETAFKNNTYQTFRSLFDSDIVIEDAKDLLLPATTLVPSCYRSMFGNCTNLTTAPELPATNLAEYCYRYMFYNTKITVAPTLPATTLANGCYYQMFQQTSIITAPVLSATNLADECYYYMFNDCTSLTTAPELPATTLALQCYYQMFYGCTSLTTAPSLPATTLTNGCYQYMFKGCTLINKIKCLATDISASYATKYWLARTSETGTFTKAAGVEWPEGDSGIPTGWTVVEEPVS